MIRRAAILAVGVMTLAGCATPSLPEPAGDGGWTELAPFPLVARQSALTAWTGSEALFLGGDPGPPCLDTGGAGDCEVPPGLRDGAAFDPAAGTWRTTAEAPVPVTGSLPSAVSGQTVYVLRAGQLLSYDASDDAWTVHPPLVGAPEYARLAVVDGAVVVVAGERRSGEPSGHVYDPAVGTWSLLPEDPLGPAFDRVPTATPAGLVLTGHELVPDPGATEPSLVRAALLDPATSQWRLLPDSEQLGGWQWTWTGRHLLDPTLGAVDGGLENPYGRTIPMGGVLDPATGEWGPLPNAPGRPSDGWRVEALGGPVVATWGWVYDDRDESWTVLPRPGGAPPEPGSAVWAGERLIVLGGIDPERGMTLDALVDGAWAWTPGGSLPEESPGSGLAGVWALRSGTFEGEEIGIPDHARGTIEFDGRRVGGTAFCNGFGGTYRLDGAALELQDIAQTLIGCDGEIAAAENAYLGVLLAPELTARLDGAELVLASDAGELRFFRLPPVPVDDLVGVRWLLQSVRDAHGDSPAGGEPAVLELRADGTVAFSTGCQTMTGTWTTHGDSVLVADHEYDPSACPPELAEQDSLVTRIIGSAFQVSVDGDVLSVFDVDDLAGSGMTLVYRAG